MARVLAIAGMAVVAAIVTPLAIAAGVGWTYVFWELGWFAAGPRVGDSLPLLQLAGLDAQPLVRIIIAWVATGLVAGILLARLPRSARIATGAGVGAGCLLLASQASYAVARNQATAHVLWSRWPGAGPWIAALLFMIGLVLVAQRTPGSDSPAHTRLSGPQLWCGGILHHLRLGGGQRRNAREDDGHGDQVADNSEIGRSQRLAEHDDPEAERSDRR